MSDTRENHPAYFAIIPANVRYCKDLEPSAKLLYGEITALCNKEGYCWAGDKYFADLYGAGLSTIKKWISSLKKLGFIWTEQYNVGFNKKRRIYIVELKKSLQGLRNETMHGLENETIDGVKNETISISKNNTKNNNTSDDDDRVRGADRNALEKVPKKKDLDEIDLDVEKINTKGQSIKATQSEIFRHFVGKPYSADVIKQAIKRTQTAQGPMNDILKYISTVCDEITRQTAKESVSKKSKSLTKIKVDPSVSPSEESRKRLEQEKKEWVSWENYTKNQKIAP